LHQNLKCLSQIEEASLKHKNQKRFIFRPRSIHASQNTGPKISWDSPFKCKIFKEEMPEDKMAAEMFFLE
jgi:hypothetical protein